MHSKPLTHKGGELGSVLKDVFALSADAFVS